MDKFRPESFLPLTPVAFEILLALADGERHGYASCRKSKRRSGGAVSLHAGTLYRALARLLESELIEELRKSPDPKNDDERRRYYRLTTRGIAVAQSGGRTARGTAGGGPHRRLLKGARREERPLLDRARSPIREPSGGDSAPKCATTSVAHRGPDGTSHRWPRTSRNGFAERWSAIMRWACFPNVDSTSCTNRQGGTTCSGTRLRADIRHTIRLAIKTPVFTHADDPGARARHRRHHARSSPSSTACCCERCRIAMMRGS